MSKPVKIANIEWVGDKTDYALFLSNGSVFVLRSDDHVSEPGLYLPDGTWKPFETQPRRMGF
jgi:hypothetical protein